MNTENTAGQQQPDQRTFEILKDAYQKGQLQFQRSLTYQQQPARLGFVFYLINYVNEVDIIYQGAFEISLKVEEHLKLKDWLTAYLVWQLAFEL